MTNTANTTNTSPFISTKNAQDNSKSKRDTDKVLERIASFLSPHSFRTGFSSCSKGTRALCIGNLNLRKIVMKEASVCFMKIAQPLLCTDSIANRWLSLQRENTPDCISKTNVLESFKTQRSVQSSIIDSHDGLITTSRRLEAPSEHLQFRLRNFLIGMGAWLKKKKISGYIDRDSTNFSLFCTQLGYILSWCSWIGDEPKDHEALEDFTKQIKESIVSITCNKEVNDRCKIHYTVTIKNPDSKIWSFDMDFSYIDTDARFISWRNISETVLVDGRSCKYVVLYRYSKDALISKFNGYHLSEGKQFGQIWWYNGDETIFDEGLFSNYRKLTGEGRVIKTTYDNKVTYKSEGVYEDSELQGAGQEQYFDLKSGVHIVHIGDFINGTPNGEGTYSEFNKDGILTNRCCGNFVNGVLHGNGTETTTILACTGDQIEEYKGVFKDGYLDGTGTKTLSTIDRKLIEEYTGGFEVSEFHGNGSLKRFGSDGSTVTEEIKGVWNMGKLEEK